MWQCSKCDYLNEDLDDTCQKCGTDRNAQEEQAADAAPDAAPAAPPAASPVQPKQPEPSEVQLNPPGTAERRERATTNAISVLLIVACIVGLAAVGYFAWQRGLIRRIFGGEKPAAVAQDQQEAEDIWADAPPCPAGFKRHTKEERDAVDAIMAYIPGVEVKFDENGALTPESDAALTELAKLGNDLAWQYGEFEKAVVEAKDPQLGEYAQFVRDRFENAMIQSLQVAAKAYGNDLKGEHAAYLLSDTYVQAADEYSLIDSAQIHTVWDSAIHARQQMLLDRQYTEQYRQLAARVEALKEIHREFNKQLSAMPPYKIRSGILGKDARDLLDLLGELADKIQDMVLEFEEYKSSISGLEQSDRMKEYYSQFESLAKTDHLYAFQEIYKIYEQDRELNHPVYQKLKDYYQFALDHWSESALSYQQVYEQSEATWARKWAQE